MRKESMDGWTLPSYQTLYALIAFLLKRSTTSCPDFRKEDPDMAMCT